MVLTFNPFAILFLALKSSNKDFCGASTTWMLFNNLDALFAMVIHFLTNMASFGGRFGTRF